MGAAQLVYKAYLRTLKIKGLRELVAMGGKALEGVVAYTNMMSRFQGIEGVTLVDGEDEFEAQAHGAFTGLDDVLTQFAQQLSGASQIPLTRLFGQSPGGLNSTGESDLRNYYDKIRQHQESGLGEGVTLFCRLAAQSRDIELPPDFGVEFRSLWQLSDTEKSTIAKEGTATVLSGLEAGVVPPKVVLQELRALAAMTGIWGSITSEQVDEADDELPPRGEGMFDPQTGEQHTLPDGSPVKSQAAGDDPQGKKDAGSQGGAAPVVAGKGRRPAVRR